jgi:hypothetical protein
LRPRAGLGSACVALCNCVAENSDDFMFLKVCCGLDLDTSFALYLVQDDDITVLTPSSSTWRISSGRVKKPVMTKRASLGASSVSGVK